MAIEIPLRNIKREVVAVALIDGLDYELVSQYSWSRGGCNQKYAVTFVGKKPILMHRLILNAAKGKVVDHRNGNGLDNRRLNIRECSQSDNLLNSRLHKNNTAGAKGVSFDKLNKKYRASIKYKGKNYWLGRFDTLEAAKLAYHAKALELNRDFANSGV